MNKTLRPYQIQSNEAIINALNRGVTSMLNVMATGTGKSLTTIRLIEQLGYNRTLWLSDRITLIEQSGCAFIEDKFDSSFRHTVEQIGFLNWVKNHNGRFAKQNTNFKIGAIKAEIFEINANVCMGSLQTINNRLDRLPSDYFDCIICDEAHGYSSPTASRTLAHFKPKLLLGLTATPHRADGVQLGNIFHEIVFDYPIKKGIDEGYLCELDGIRVQTQIDLDKVHTQSGDFNEKELEQEVNVPKRNILIATSFIKYCGERQAIGFCVNIKHALDLAECFRDYGINAIAISSDKELTPDSQLKIKQYKEGKYQVIFNCGMLIAGFDHPNTGAIIEASPTKSLTKYLQTIGRGTRLKDKNFVDKYGQRCIILDICDSTKRHNIINTWSLDKGLEPTERLFITKEKCDKLLADRITRFKASTKKDEKFVLLSLPKAAKASNSIRMTESATTPQIKWIKRLGYNPAENEYTKAMCFDIISQQECAKYKIQILKDCNYSIEGEFITNGIFENAKKLNKKVADLYEIKSKQLQKR